jgi:hypothetical protein
MPLMWSNKMKQTYTNFIPYTNAISMEMTHYFTLYIHNQMTEVTQLIGHLHSAINVV